MKKIFLLVLICCADCVFAQKSFFGVEAGINVANQRTATTYTLNGATLVYAVGYEANNIQPTFGVFYHLRFTEALSIRVNAQYMGMGYSTKTSDPGVNINYLTFPVTFHYNANKHFSLNAGSYISFTLGGTKINNQDITKTYHKNDLGLSLGAEHDLWKNFAIGVNYFMGLKNIWLDDEVVPGPGAKELYKHTNRTLQITLIYKFKKTN